MAENEDVITVRIGNMDLSEHPDVTAVVFSQKVVSFDATPLIPTLRRAGEASFDASFSDDWSLSDEDIVLFGGDPSWTARSSGPSREPDPVAPDGSYCDHPEDRREPLPYQGRAADPREWECGACGVWHLAEATTAKVRDDWREAEKKAFRSFDEAGTSRLDAVKKFSQQMAISKEIIEDASDLYSTVREAFEKMASTRKFDARGSLEIGFETEHIESTSVFDYGTVVIPSRRTGYVRGPISDGMTDDEVKSVIYEIDLAARRLSRASRHDPYWVMDSDALLRIHAMDMRHAIAYSVRTATRTLIGHPVRVETNVPRGTIALVVE